MGLNMQVEVHFDVWDGEKSPIYELISKTGKSLNGFFSTVPDDWGYSFCHIEGNVWSLSGSPVFMFRLLDKIMTRREIVSGFDILAVDTYIKTSDYIAARSNPSHNFRFRTPHYISLIDEATKKVIFEDVEPRTIEDAESIKSSLESGAKTVSDLFGDKCEIKCDSTIVSIKSGNPFLLSK